jgi:hypothetical protein
MKNATWAALSVGLVGILLLAFTGNPGMAWPLVALFGLAAGSLVWPGLWNPKHSLFCVGNEIY